MNEKSLSNEVIKQRTLELYAQLPDDEEGRKARIDIRDQIIELNYKFFGFVASHTYIPNTSVSYEDKFQSALVHFCEIWWKYMFKGSESHRGYRTDLSFAVFFKPRLSEEIERELVDVKYSVRRSLCMEAAAQLGVHWAKVRYEDLRKVNLPKDKMDSLKAIFGSIYIADLDTHSIYLQADRHYISSIHDTLTDEYDSLEDLLIHEMIETEEKITPRMLSRMADMYQVDLDTLKELLPVAEKKLYDMLIQNEELNED